MPRTIDHEALAAIYAEINATIEQPDGKANVPIFQISDALGLMRPTFTKEENALAFAVWITAVMKAYLEVWRDGPYQEALLDNADEWGGHAPMRPDEIRPTLPKPRLH